MSRGNVVSLPTRGDETLTKAQLANHLGVSTRTLENRAREGMPCLPGVDRFGRRRYRLSDVLAWMEDGARERPRDRLSELEERVERLERSAR